MLLGGLTMLFIDGEKTPERLLKVFRIPVSTSTNISSSNKSKWGKNKLVVIPAVWKEINWANCSSWSLWLRHGLDLFNNASRSHDVHLYQRIDPNSKPPYDWPYCTNVQEEAGDGYKYFGTTLEHRWHVIIGFNPTNMPPSKINTGRCHLFRSSCIGSPCSKKE